MASVPQWRVSWQGHRLSSERSHAKSKQSLATTLVQIEVLPTANAGLRIFTSAPGGYEPIHSPTHQFESVRTRREREKAAV